ncbi:MAG: M13 family metallopeptidase N-terminal domain-containing protein [Bacteroidota bacterium]
MIGRKTDLLTVLILGFLIGACTDKSKQKQIELTDTHAGINLDYIDSTQRPQEDFFKFVNGNWLSQTEIPGDQGRWGSFNELRDYNDDILLKVLKEAAEGNQYGPETDQGKAAAFYSIGMDSLLAEQAGIKPLAKYLDKVDKLNDKKELVELIAEMAPYSFRPFFNMAIRPDRKKSDEIAVYISQGGLGLPNRDYYLKTDEKSEQIKENYLQYIKGLSHHFSSCLV